MIKQSQINDRVSDTRKRGSWPAALFFPLFIAALMPLRMTLSKLGAGRLLTHTATIKSRRLISSFFLFSPFTTGKKEQPCISPPPRSVEPFKLSENVSFVCVCVNRLMGHVCFVYRYTM